MYGYEVDAPIGLLEIKTLVIATLSNPMAPPIHRARLVELFNFILYRCGLAKSMIRALMHLIIFQLRMIFSDGNHTKQEILEIAKN